MRRKCAAYEQQTEALKLDSAIAKNLKEPAYGG